MSTERDDAVVLRLTEYSETSQIVTLFGARDGLLRLIAKGARRSTKTRFAAGLDLLEAGEVSYVPPKGDAQLGTLTEWVQRDAFSGLRRDLLRLQGALYAVELVAGLTADFDPHPGLHAGLTALLRGLSDQAAPATCVPVFQWVLLREIGYVPQMDRCAGCHRGMPGERVVYFSSAAGGVLCRDCEVNHVEKMRLSAGLLQSTPERGDVRAWFDLLDYHLTHVAGKRFRTAPALGRLLARQRRSDEATERRRGADSEV